jgi:phosphoribosyl-dephospho-CoA transferase
MRVCAAPPWTQDTLPVPDPRRRAHDLLKLRRLRAFDREPAWVRDAFARAPFVVVRRAEAAAGFAAVGVRGAERAQRFGTWADTADIESAFAPEDLVHATPHCARAHLPAFAALTALRGARCIAAFAWGPAGSVGFELATGVPAVRAASDLDLLIRAGTALSRDDAYALLTELTAHAAHAGIRIDVQLETPAGGVALSELAANKARVMARGAQGPRLVADPWADVQDTA